jgi:hypothetical protein
MILKNLPTLAFRCVASALTHIHDVKAEATHLKAKVGKFFNIINPNHRHDEEHETIDIPLDAITVVDGCKRLEAV